MHARLEIGTQRDGGLNDRIVGGTGDEWVGDLMVGDHDVSVYRSGETVLLARGQAESGGGSRDGSRAAGPRRQYPPAPQRGLGSVRWTLVLVACACGLILATGRAEGQQPPGAPTIGSVTAGTSTLTISWSAPAESGGTPITSYDLRYIPSNATAKEDPDNWTVQTGIGTTDVGTARRGPIYVPTPKGVVHIVPLLVSWTLRSR